MLKISNLRSLQTPFWYYDMDLFRRTVDEAVRASEKYGIHIHYSIKANSEPRLLAYMLKKGLGVDCVSGNEVAFALEQGFDPSKIVFAGVGKTDAELLVGLRAGIASFNCESVEEVERLDELAAEYGLKANISLRVNPDVDAHTHKFITTGLETDKFGIPRRDVDRVISLLKGSNRLNFKGLHFHIGSQILDVENVFTDECQSANDIVAHFESEGLYVSNIDLGGGLGIDYKDPDENPIPDFDLWFRVLREKTCCSANQELHVEPGRSLVGQCGSLVSSVIFVKRGESRTFVIADTGLNDLLRPALYGAYHKVDNLTSTAYETALYEIAGPICESSDIIGEDRVLPLTTRGDVLAIRSAGAYGAAMSSHYNMRTPARAIFSDDLK